MSGDQCTICFASLALVGRVHNCRPRPVAAPVPAPLPTSPVANRIESLLANTVANGNGVANSSTYRHRDPTKRRAYMRELMRRRRETAKA